MEFGGAQLSWGEHTWISKLQLWLIHQCGSKQKLLPGIFYLPNYFLVRKGLFFLLQQLRKLNDTVSNYCEFIIHSKEEM